MIIKDIELNNIGSYEGVTVFDFTAEDNKNIILIGGKNGAGKTTLFTAIRICIYGYKSFGYQSLNSFYNKAIIKLINNKSKLQEPSNAHIKLNFSINNGQDVDSYLIERSWVYNKNSVVESLKIYKNSVSLSDEEILDFENYIMQIIPPDLFDLYFFDGEKIADFFLEEGSKVRLKNAFLTLCGYDIFEIMNKNFRRILSSSSINNDVVKSYLEFKEDVDKASKKIEDIKDRIILNYKNIDELDSKVKQLDKAYKKNGGVLKTEWDNKFQAIKNEEKFREEQNAWLKKAANDTIPFLILKRNLDTLKQVIKREEEAGKYKAFTDLLQEKYVQNLFANEFKAMQNIDSNLKVISKCIKNDVLKKEILLDLSSEQAGLLNYQIKKLQEFPVEDIENVVQSIKKSIKKSQVIRDEIEKCNIDKIDDYVNEKSKLLDEKTKLLNLSVKLGNDIQKEESEFAILNSNFQKSKKEYEQELKKNSINDISSKAVLFLDKLESELYIEQINKVKESFNVEINKLMRKQGFINDIDIDSDFNISVYRTENYNIQELLDLKQRLGDDGIINTLGKRALEKIKNIKDAQSDKVITIDVELNKTSFSNGEKQIFIMALYKSLMKLCRYEVPFVIDTPFARIDTEHRDNISQYFFRELKGQVFILSTNEEVEDKQFEMLKDKLAATYMLENSDNKKTTVEKNKYFTEV